MKAVLPARPVPQHNSSPLPTATHPSRLPRQYRALPVRISLGRLLLLSFFATALAGAAVSLPLWAPALSATSLAAALTSSPAAYAATAGALDFARLPPTAAGPSTPLARPSRTGSAPASAAETSPLMSAAAADEMETALDLVFLLAVTCTFSLQRQSLTVKLQAAVAGSAAVLLAMAVVHWSTRPAQFGTWLCG